MLIQLSTEIGATYQLIDHVFDEVKDDHPDPSGHSPLGGIFLVIIYHTEFNKFDHLLKKTKKEQGKMKAVHSHHFTPAYLCGVSCLLYNWWRIIKIWETSIFP
jgi:hypothetical protein